MSALLGLVLLVAPGCFEATVTAYVRGHHSPWTFDGTSIWTDEAIAAAGPEIPINSLVEVEGLGVYRVADRGSGVGYRHIDIAVYSVADAYAITSVRTVCVSPPGGPLP